MTAVKFDNQYVVECRVYRKSDNHYWACTVQCYPASVIGSVQQVQAWAAGLSMHPNFSVMTVDSILSTGKAEPFEAYNDKLRVFLDGRT